MMDETIFFVLIKPGRMWGNADFLVTRKVSKNHDDGVVVHISFLQGKCWKGKHKQKQTSKQTSKNERIDLNKKGEQQLKRIRSLFLVGKWAVGKEIGMRLKQHYWARKGAIWFLCSGIATLGLNKIGTWIIHFSYTVHVIMSNYSAFNKCMN